MTAPQFTPGPWVIDDRPLYLDGSGLNSTPRQRGNVVADCPTAFGGHCVVAPSTAGLPCPKQAEMDATGLANAHLISAAPELYESLRVLVESYGFVDFASEEERERDDDYREARRALAKAVANDCAAENQEPTRG